MKKKLIFVFLGIFVLTMAIVAFAFDQTAGKSAVTKHHCCNSSSSCPMKSNSETAQTDATSCCDSDACCCKGDACPMKGHEQSEKMAAHHATLGENAPASEQTNEKTCCDCDCCKDKADA